MPVQPDHLGRVPCAILWSVILASRMSEVSLREVCVLAILMSLLAGHLLVVVLSGGPWTIEVFIRLIIVAVLAFPGRLAHIRTAEGGESWRRYASYLIT